MWAPICAQDTVTGAFEGTVSNSQTGGPLKGAVVEITNQQTGLRVSLRTDFRGRFYHGLLLPGIYRIRVSTPDYEPREVLQELKITYPGEVVPVPVALDPVAPGTVAAPTPVLTAADTQIRASLNRIDGRRSGSFSAIDVVTIPLGGITLTRTFDELALLLPGVAPPPQTLGSVAGPGVGAGVGSAGQFAVNGLRSRGNNFTVDGSDNNDEDIGVRRQGFVSLIPQPIESIQEYQVTTLLAPAQFGRNIGGQVNAVSKSGGSEVHGTVYGAFNSSQLNARNFFDTAFGNAVTTVRANNQDVIVRTRDLNRNIISERSLTVRNQSGGEDSSTLGIAGLALGGPLKPNKIFYFVSAEAQSINATKEESFAVPTLSQRGAFGTGATGIFRDPLNGNATATIPTSMSGSAVFSLFPFPNNPGGVYGLNTFTQVLPASGLGRVLSGKIDDNFRVMNRAQSATARYNFTDDWRNIPASGGAIFSTLTPHVRTQNFSFFLNSELSDPNTTAPIFNQVRLSYGRTRLRFEEERDNDFLLPSALFPNTPFLLNAPLLLNTTQPAGPGLPNTGAVIYESSLITGGTAITSVERLISGALGQISVAGFSPVGVDVFNFPQRRVNNTYQLADNVTWRTGDHSLAFGTDNRRSELNSNLPRNARPLVTYNGAPRLVFENGAFRLPTSSDSNTFLRPEDLVSLDAASGFFLTLNTQRSDPSISLRYYQISAFAQDSWSVGSNLTISYGLRYEYNTPVRELNRRIENTFSAPELTLVPPLLTFIADRTQIFDPDRNNFAPRVGFAYSPQLTGGQRVSVFRAGYGIYYDQILGSVVSQSRNVFPTFLTLNFGGLAESQDDFFTFFNPAATRITTVPGRPGVPILQPGTIDQLNPDLTPADLINFAQTFFTSAVGATLPARRLETPTAHHYTFSFEQQLNSNVIVSAAYVGTQGRHLLRFSTPNLGPGITLVPTSFVALQRGGLQVPIFTGRVRVPQRPARGIGAVNIFETTAASSYNSLQGQLRGRWRRALQYQVAYTFSKVTDDVSDIFDLAGASGLPQNSLTFAGERGPANFDARHRFSYNFVWDLPARLSKGPLGLLFEGLQVAGTGRFQTGQPFTVNSIFDVNLDGNLTDRLNTTNGIEQTGHRRQPLRLTTANTAALLAPIGQDGRIERNSFRAGNVLELDLMLNRAISIRSGQTLSVRADLFNFINWANFGIPARFLEAPGFGHATTTITPGRRVQLSVKYSF